MTENQTSCVFCKIIRGQLPSATIYSDDEVIVFLDIHPINPGHTLIVPKSHAVSLAELDPIIGGRLFQVAQRIAAALRHSGLQCEGINLWLADGKVAFQEVPHVHLHVIPRHQDDGLRLMFGPDYGETPSSNILGEQAALIRQALEKT